MRNLEVYYAFLCLCMNVCPVESKVFQRAQPFRTKNAYEGEMERGVENRERGRRKIYGEGRFWVTLYRPAVTGLNPVLSIPHTLYFLFSDSDPKINLLQWAVPPALSSRRSLKVFF